MEINESLFNEVNSQLDIVYWETNNVEINRLVNIIRINNDRLMEIETMINEWLFKEDDNATNDSK